MSIRVTARDHSQLRILNKACLSHQDAGELPKENGLQEQSHGHPGKFLEPGAYNQGNPYGRDHSSLTQLRGHSSPPPGSCPYSSSAYTPSNPPPGRFEIPSGLLWHFTLTSILAPTKLFGMVILCAWHRVIKDEGGYFPSGPVAKTLHSLSRGPGFNPRSGN